MTDPHWTDIIFQVQTDPRLSEDRPDVAVPSDHEFFRRVEQTYSEKCRAWEEAGQLDWSALMIEATYAAMGEPKDNLRRAKLLRVAATAIAWSDAIQLRDDLP